MLRQIGFQPVNFDSELPKIVTRDVAPCGHASLAFLALPYIEPGNAG